MCRRRTQEGVGGPGGVSAERGGQTPQEERLDGKALHRTAGWLISGLASTACTPPVPSLSFCLQKMGTGTGTSFEVWF